jgi:MFS transporter, BCD family, chlorophyll transporter
MSMIVRPTSWFNVARCGLAQMAIGAVAALMTSTLNRVMVVELSLPATVPGVLVALHFLVQMSRSRFGYESDRLSRRAPLILGGSAVLAAGGVLAAFAVSVAATQRVLGLALAVVAFVLIGIGMSASGTALLALVAERVEPRHRGGAAALLWIMMIFGIAVTAGSAGSALDPFSMSRLIVVTSVVCGVALVLAVIGVTGLESRWPRQSAEPPPVGQASFAAAWRAVSGEPATVRFALFVFVAMLAYSMQDLILEPFAGRVFGMSPGASTRLSGSQHAGVMLGMFAAAIASARVGTLRGWAAAGCLASAIALATLALLPVAAGATMLSVTVFILGVANGVFAVGALGAMMGMTAGPKGEGVGLRLGVYGAAQALAYGIGGTLGGVASDLAIYAFGHVRLGYAAVFATEAALFVGSAWLAMRIGAVQSVREVDEAHRGDVLWAYRQ